MDLKDVIAKIKREDADAAAFEAAKPQRQDAWLSSFKTLRDHFVRVLDPYQTDGDLTLEQPSADLPHTEFGGTLVQVLLINVRGRFLRLVPDLDPVIGYHYTAELQRVSPPKSHAYDASSHEVLKKIDIFMGGLVGTDDWAFKSTDLKDLLKQIGLTGNFTYVDDKTVSMAVAQLLE